MFGAISKVIMSGLALYLTVQTSEVMRPVAANDNVPMATTLSRTAPGTYKVNVSSANNLYWLVDGTQILVECSSKVAKPKSLDNQPALVKYDGTKTICQFI